MLRFVRMLGQFDHLCQAGQTLGGFFFTRQETSHVPRPNRERKVMPEESQTRNHQALILDCYVNTWTIFSMVSDHNSCSTIFWQNCMRGWRYTSLSQVPNWRMTEPLENMTLRRPHLLIQQTWMAEMWHVIWLIMWHRLKWYPEGIHRWPQIVVPVLLRCAEIDTETNWSWAGCILLISRPHGTKNKILLKW